MLSLVEKMQNLETVSNALFGSWIVSSYEKGQKNQRDFFLDESHTRKGSTAYLFEHETQTFTKLVIVECLQSSPETCVDTLLKYDPYCSDISAKFITENDCYAVWFRYHTVCLSGWDLVFSTIREEDYVFLPDTNTLECYFIGPKELLNLFLAKEYPDAIYSKIKLEVDANERANMERALVSISPVRRTENGIEDYDWNYICIPESIRSRLLEMVFPSSDICFQNVDTVCNLPFDLTFWCSIRHIPETLIEKAKEIDKGVYEIERFSVGLSLTKDGFSFVCEEPDCMVCYTSNDGSVHGLKYVLSNREKQTIISGCLAYLGNQFQ